MPQCPELLADNNRLQTLNAETWKQWKQAGRDNRKGPSTVDSPNTESARVRGAP